MRQSTKYLLALIFSLTLASCERTQEGMATAILSIYAISIALILGYIVFANVLGRDEEMEAMKSGKLKEYYQTKHYQK